MDREQFIEKTRLLIKDPRNKNVERWISFAEENVSLGQYVKFVETPKEEAVSAWLDTLYASLYFAKKKYGVEVAKKVVDLSEIPLCLYSFEIMEAARLMRDGATPDKIEEAIDDGTLTQDENLFPSLEDVKRDQAKSGPER